MTTKMPDVAAARCAGCGQTFRGLRGLRAHQSKRFVAMSCRPLPKVQTTEKGRKTA